MFDKNIFKQDFRRWFAANPAVSEIEVREFCQTNIPAGVYLQNYWLVEQTLEWYRWQIRNSRSELEAMTSIGDGRMVS